MELHAHGASFLAQSKDSNPLELVELVVKKMPDADRKERFAEFEQLLTEEGEAYERAVRWYFFVNMHDYLTTRRSKPLSPEARREQAAAQAAAQREAVDTIKGQIMLLALTMPNGMAMSACTGSDMDKFGGAYKAIAKRVGPRKTVGEVLTEEQVRALVKP